MAAVAVCNAAVAHAAAPTAAAAARRGAGSVAWWQPLPSGHGLLDAYNTYVVVAVIVYPTTKVLRIFRLEHRLSILREVM